VWDAEEFARLVAGVAAELAGRSVEVVGRVLRVLAAKQPVDGLVAEVRDAAVLADVREQLDGLVYPGFVTATGWERLADLPRYLAAIARRLEKLPDNPARDRDWMRRVQAVQGYYRELLDQLSPGEPAGEDLLRIRWMIEELRVSYFAQTLGTAYPISDKRVIRAMDELTP
jgi:ATP-dependent helicase HrpA